VLQLKGIPRMKFSFNISHLENIPMKITGISAALVIGLGLAASQSAFASDGEIEFTGTVEDITCSINGQPSGANNIDIPVPLGGVNKGQLAKEGDTGGEMGFRIQVGKTGETTCTNGKTAYVRFDKSSPLMDALTGRLNIDNPGVGGNASNVQIQVLDAGGTVIDMFTQDSKGYVISNNQTVIPLLGRMYATGQATEGKVASRVGFEVVYD